MLEETRSNFIPRFSPDVARELKKLLVTDNLRHASRLVSTWKDVITTTQPTSIYDLIIINRHDSPALFYLSPAIGMFYSDQANTRLAGQIFIETFVLKAIYPHAITYGNINGMQTNDDAFVKIIEDCVARELNHFLRLRNQPQEVVYLEYHRWSTTLAARTNATLSGQPLLTFAQEIAPESPAFDIETWKGALKRIPERSNALLKWLTTEQKQFTVRQRLLLEAYLITSTEPDKMFANPPTDIKPIEILQTSAEILLILIDQLPHGTKEKLAWQLFLRLTTQA